MSKKKIKKIQDYDPWYNFLYKYVKWTLRLSYKRMVYTGAENIPTDGAIIFAPNHTNALMDALVVLTHDDRAKVFVARADIFRNPTLAKIFHFLKIMPIMRIRDGFNEVKKNQEIIDKAVDVLKDKIPFCIFPEGTHLAKYSSLPLSKGIFRIAFQAHELMPQVPLYILPTGIRYGDIFRYRTTVHVQIGQPINVGEFIREHAALTPQEQMNVMKDLLAERIQSSILYIPNDDDYDATYEICNIAQPDEIRTLLNEKSKCGIEPLVVRSQANQQTLNRIFILKENHPEMAARLLELGRKAHDLRLSKNIDLKAVSVGSMTTSRLLENLLVILTLPYSMAASLAVAPLQLLCMLVFRKIKDLAFRSSVRYVIYLVLWPLLMAVYALIAFLLLPWQCALVSVLLLVPSPTIAHMLWNKVSLTVSRVKLLANKKLNRLHAEIKEILKGA